MASSSASRPSSTRTTRRRCSRRRSDGSPSGSRRTSPKSPWISASRARSSSTARRSPKQRNTSRTASSRPAAWGRRSRPSSRSWSTAGSTRSLRTSSISSPRSPARPARNSGGRERGRIFPAHGVRGAPMPKVPKRWYEDFFGSDYLIRYVHPETAAQVEAIDKILHLRKGGRILDVACGAGRHTIELARRGYRVTGLDLSSPLLAEARRAARQAGVKATFVQGDMRRLRYRNAFDAAISMFTSFGYFDRPEEDREVLRGIARALRPRGKFLMELFNRDSLVARLPSQSWQARDDGTVVLEDASFDLLRGRFETRQVIIDRKGTREFTASVRAYTLAELKEMLDAEGLFVHRVLGGLDLSPYTARSQRMVLYAVKGLEPEGIRTMW